MTVVTFHVGPVLCGAEVDCVQEVLRHQELTPIPLAAAATPGLLHLRGQILTAIDLRSVFDLPARDSGTKPVCVIVRKGESAASLLADRIGEVVEVEPDAIEAPPTHWQGPMREFSRGVTDRSDQLLLLLDAMRILDIESSQESPQDEIN
jgi:purine-binding chemotaxis protein CheW